MNIIINAEKRLFKQRGGTFFCVQLITVMSVHYDSLNCIFIVETNCGSENNEKFLPGIKWNKWKLRGFKIFKDLLKLKNSNFGFAN